MTTFENYFASLKKALKREDIYSIWPDFEPIYDEREYAWTNLRGLGDALLLNCGKCEGPSDMRHNNCKSCVEKRKNVAKNKYQKTVGLQIENWPTLILCRIHTE